MSFEPIWLCQAGKGSAFGKEQPEFCLPAKPGAMRKTIHMVCLITGP
jgi:hypothetical protein